MSQSGNAAKKRDIFEALFNERRAKFENNGSLSTTDNAVDDVREPPPKKRKLNEQINDKISHANIDSKWECKICTFHNKMDDIKCEICQTVRDFSEKIITNNESKDDIKIEIKNDDHVCKNKVEIKVDNTVKEFVFITWNVWFNEELMLDERINEIGKIVSEKKCDILCLQEVTPEILRLITESEWFKNDKWRYTRYPLERLRYFTLLLSKFEFIGDFQVIPCIDTVMERFIIVAPLLIGDSIVTIATTHLESPIRHNMENKSALFSKERVKQFDQLIGILNKYENVIIGADFNWCDKTKNHPRDGDMNDHLNDKWQDCWIKLHPKKPGYTYDMKLNDMLYGWLRSRNDRILMKGNGFTLKSIHIIGTKPIGNLTYKKPIKKGTEMKTLKVLPSDHFGLCAVFALL